MSTIVTRSGKGSPLTNTEIDANFNNLNTDKLETGSLSVTTNSAGTAGLAYTSNVFTYTPPDLSGFAALSGAAFTGAITTNSTFDGRDVATDGTKLDGIEASADVTDTANVTASGALMDSEVTNLAQVKAFDSSDYATATQGATADAALPKSGGALTGAVTTNSTFDGVDIAVRDAVLTTTTNTANAALPKAGGTMTGPLVIDETTAVKMSAGTTAQRPTGVAGHFRYNTTEGKFEGYSTEWGEIGGGAADLKLNSFTGNGSTTVYTLSSSPTEDNTLVYIDGVYQNKTAYSIVDTGLTFSAAPANGAAIEITAATIAAVQASTEFKLNQFTGDNSTVAFALSAQTTENSTAVYFDGVYQSKSNYSISGLTLTFSTAPATGVAVEVMAANAVVVSIGTPDNGTVTTAKIVDANVTTAKIANDAVTSDKLAHSLDVVTGLTVGGASNGVAITNGAIALKNSGTQSKIDFYCEVSNAHYTRIQAAPHSSYAGNIVLTLPASDGDAGQFLQSNGSGVMSWAAAGGLYNTWLVKTANYTMLSGDQIVGNHASTAFTLTLPASPSAGDVVTVKNVGAALITVGRNGSNINSAANDASLPQNNAAQLVYVDSTIGWTTI